MTLGRRELKTIYGALLRAAEWEESMANGNESRPWNMGPELRKECKKARRLSEKYAALAKQIHAELFPKKSA